MTHLLLDGDVMVYRFGNAAQETGSWSREGGGSVVYSYARPEKARAEMESFIEDLLERFDADGFTLALSDPKENWRFRTTPGYKGNRSNVARPLVYWQLRDWAIEKLGANVEPMLEGDDLLGIWATQPGAEGNVVVCSIDKDMRTIPGRHFNWDKDEEFEVTEEEADYFHLFQTLCGDRVDCYQGCPGVGPVKAKRLLDADPSWRTVKMAFVKAGLTEDHALVNAQAAHIMRHGDYNFETKAIRLWTPGMED